MGRFEGVLDHRISLQGGGHSTLPLARGAESTLIDFVLVLRSEGMGGNGHRRETGNTRPWVEECAFREGDKERETRGGGGGGRERERNNETEEEIIRYKEKEDERERERERGK